MPLEQPTHDVADQRDAQEHAETDRHQWPGSLQHQGCFAASNRLLEGIDRIEHRAEGKSTPIGIVPTAADMDLSGLDVDASDVDQALVVNVDEWRKELPLIEEWFEFVGEKLPTGIRDELDALKTRLAEVD